MAARCLPAGRRAQPPADRGERDVSADEPQGWPARSCVESHDEWQAGERRYLSEGSMALLAGPSPDPEEVATPALLTA
jgi:hypothetical protein